MEIRLADVKYVLLLDLDNKLCIYGAYNNPFLFFAPHNTCSCIRLLY